MLGIYTLGSFQEQVYLQLKYSFKNRGLFDSDIGCGLFKLFVLNCLNKY